MGFDLNRHWQEPSPWAHPTLYATKNLLLEFDRDDVSKNFSNLSALLQRETTFIDFLLASLLKRGLLREKRFCSLVRKAFSSEKRRPGSSLSLTKVY